MGVRGLIHDLVVKARFNLCTHIKSNERGGEDVIVHTLAGSCSVYDTTNNIITIYQYFIELRMQFDSYCVKCSPMRICVSLPFVQYFYFFETDPDLMLSSVQQSDFCKFSWILSEIDRFNFDNGENKNIIE